MYFNFLSTFSKPPHDLYAKNSFAPPTQLGHLPPVSYDASMKRLKNANINTSASAKREIYSVSAINRRVRGLLEGEFPAAWIEGEISNLASPASGHIYFSLKDSSAQLRCAMFRNKKSLLRFTPKNGMQIIVRGRLSLYEPRGDYQLIADHMEEAGDGALKQEFEDLKQRLSDEGLFNPENKKTLPTLPLQIGVITSPTGAAIRDILSVLARRFPAIPVIVYPTAVQGKTAGQEIAKTIALAEQRNECDVLILARGGGSLEDLWAFNEEIVARAIHQCALPIISGVGHEIDFTISDFVADLRAPTPSGAAELASPNQEEWLDTFNSHQLRLQKLAQQQITNAQQRLSWLSKRLQQQHPGNQLQQHMQQLDQLTLRLKRAITQKTQQASSRLTMARARLAQHSPMQRITQLSTTFTHRNQQLRMLIQQKLDTKTQSLTTLSRALNAVSPLATLGRGYAITRIHPAGQIVRSIKELDIGTTVETQLAEGRIISTVKEIHEN